MLLRRLARPMLAAIFIQGGIAALGSPRRTTSGRRSPSSTPSPPPSRALRTLPRRRSTRAAESAPIDVPRSATSDWLDDETLVKVDGGVKVVAGSMLALGKAPRLASTALAASLIPTTLAGHRFWEETDQQARRRPADRLLQERRVCSVGCSSPRPTRRASRRSRGAAGRRPSSPRPRRHPGRLRQRRRRRRRRTACQTPHKSVRSRRRSRRWCCRAPAGRRGQQARLADRSPEAQGGEEGVQGRVARAAPRRRASGSRGEAGCRAPEGRGQAEQPPAGPRCQEERRARRASGEEA